MVHEIISMLFDIIKLCLVFTGLFNCSFIRNKKLCVIYIAVLIMGTTVYTQIQSENNWIIWSIVFRYIVLVLLFSESIRKKTMVFIGSFLVISCLDIVISICMSDIINHPIVKLWVLSPWELLNNIITVFCLILLIRLKRFIKSKLGYSFTIPKMSYFFVVMIGTIGAIVVGCLQGYLLGEDTHTTNRILMYAILCLCLLTLGICIYFIILLNSRNHYKQLNILNKVYQHEQEAYYRNIDDMNLKLRKFRHDYNSHMNSLQYLCESKQYEELHTYLMNLETMKEELSIAYQSGNSIINAVMNSISKKSVEKGIKIIFKGFIPPDLNINSVDLCTLFSNAMENAYEACEKIPAEGDKFIHVEFKHNKDRLYVTIDNSFLHPVKIVNGIMISDKTDIENHGFGIMNMRSVVEKYHGSICWSNLVDSIRTEIALKGAVKD